MARRTSSQVALAAAQRRRAAGNAYSYAAAARRAGVSGDLVAMADALIARGDAKLIDQVERGEITIGRVLGPQGTTVRLDPVRRDRLAAAAERSGRTIHDLVTAAVDAYLELSERAAAAPPTIPADRRGTEACPYCSAGRGTPHHASCPNRPVKLAI